MRAQALTVIAIIGLSAGSGPAVADDRGEIKELHETVRQLQRQIDDLRERLSTSSEREERFRDEVRTLRDELSELRSRAMPVEPAEEIKRITEWVCEHGHTFSAAPEGGRCPFDQTPVVARLEYRKVKLDRRETLSEKLEKRLAEEARRGVAVGLSATGIVQQTAGAGPDRLRGVGSADVILLARPALETTFFVDLEAIGGDGPDPFLGSASGLNADAGSLQDSDLADRVTLREAWLAAAFFGGHLSAVGGKLDLTNYFDRNAAANDETRQFISGMFVNNPLLGQPVQGVGHEANAPGLHFGWDTFRGFKFGIGAQAPEDSGDALGRTPFLIGEIDYSTSMLGGPGNYRLWGRRNGGDDRSAAIGVSFDQSVGARARGFGRYGFQFGGRERDRHAWSLGVGVQSLPTLRPRDETGLAYGWLRAANGRVEDLAEIYHRFYVTDHLSLSLIAQYAFHLAGDEEIEPLEGVFLGGFRTQVNF
jgi:hypothetical protein